MSGITEKILERLKRLEREVERLRVKESPIMSNYLLTTAKAADSDKLDGLDSSAFLQEELSGKRSETDLDNNLTAGVFWWTNTDTHTPVSGWGWCLVLVSDGTTHNNVDNWIAQVSFCTTTMKIYYRQKVNNGAWSAWVAFTGT